MHVGALSVKENIVQGGRHRKRNWNNDDQRGQQKSNDREVSTAAMTKNVYWVLELAINPGRFEDLKTLMTAMVEATQKNELGVLNYEWAISNDQQVCHLDEHYQNSAAWETDGKPTNVGH